MKAKELIPAFAAITGADMNGMSAESIKVADRALADAGLRAKGRGPVPPEVTMQDVIRLLLGTFGSPALSRANEYAADAARFTCFDVMIKEYVPSTESHDPDAALRACIGMGRNEIEAMSLMNALITLCLHLSKTAQSGDDAMVSTPLVEVEINVSGPVIIGVQDMEIRAEIQFSGAVDHVGQPGVRRVSEVSRHVLRWIGDNFTPKAD